jgi:hypothetical protein
MSRVLAGRHGCAFRDLVQSLSADDQLQPSTIDRFERTARRGFTPSLGSFQSGFASYGRTPSDVEPPARQDFLIPRARIQVNGDRRMPTASSRKLNRHFVMDRWLDILTGEAPKIVDPPILNHYTDAFGVYGIISSNCLWATATQFSNDLSEIEYAVSLATDIINEVWGSKRHMSPWEKMLTEHLVQLFATPLHTFGQPFIVSFCEDGDLLSQWRAYGGASGFSLAFSPLSQGDSVQLICKNGLRTMIKRVVYDHDQQRAGLRFLLRQLIKLVDSFSFSVTSSKGASAHLELSLLLILEMTELVLPSTELSPKKGNGGLLRIRGARLWLERVQKTMKEFQFALHQSCCFHI